MENDKITEGLRKFAETFKNAQTERRAVILIPTHEGFMVHEVTKEIGLHAVAAQALKDKAEAERPNEDSGLTIPVVVGRSEQLPDDLDHDPILDGDDPHALGLRP